MKRWGFSGQPRTHGVSLAHRSAGSMGGSAGNMYKTMIWKGKKLPGKMGNKNRTVFSMQVYKVDPYAPRHANPRARLSAPCAPRRRPNAAVRRQAPEVAARRARTHVLARREHNLVYLKGSVPGKTGGVVRVKDTKRGRKVFQAKYGLQATPPFPTFLPGDPAAEQLVVAAPEADPLRLEG
eukprot:960406-Prymnesium_polylepis.5